MPIPVSAIQPATPAAGAKAVEPGLVLQAGTVVDARVLQAGGEGLAKILVAGVVIEALSEAPLQAGANLRLAVSTTPEGVRLAIVPPDGQAGASSAGSANGANASLDAARAASAGSAGRSNVTGAASSPSAVEAEAPPSPQALVRAALTQAVQSAAGRQASLSPLFANLSAALGQQTLPPQVQQAALALLALRVPLGANLTGEDVQQAAQRSGTFLESRLAAGQNIGAAAPDLKAGLISLKQALVASFGTSDGVPTLETGTSGAAVSRKSAGLGAPPQGGAGGPATLAGTTNTGTAQATSVQGSHVAQAPAEGDTLIPVRIVASPLAQGAGMSRAPLGAQVGAQVGTLIGLIAEALSAQQSQGNGTAAAPNGAQNLASPAPEQPPPPVRGAAPAAQPVSAATLPPDASIEEIGRTLIKDTDGALARQTLLQAASLADQPDGLAARADQQPLRVQFEIPFVTPQGTAMAHFEIAEDGGGAPGAAPAEKGWQARFTVATEPAGPVHVQVTLAGGRTSVRMWAERNETASLLRGSSEGLGAALARAELQPGDIAVSEGAPPKARAAARAGHFLDRAT